MAGPRQRPKVVDVFASDFEVHDFEDWLRVIGWADETDSNRDGAQPVRHKAVSLVIPRSSVNRLMRALRNSAGHRKEGSRH
jgi:hypothetical protein